MHLCKTLCKTMPQQTHAVIKANVWALFEGGTSLGRSQWARTERYVQPGRSHTAATVHNPHVSVGFQSESTPVSTVRHFPLQGNSSQTVFHYDQVFVCFEEGVLQTGWLRPHCAYMSMRRDEATGRLLYCALVSVSPVIFSCLLAVVVRQHKWSSTLVF